MAFEKELFSISLPSDVDLSDWKTYQFTPIWQGAAQNVAGTGHGGNAVMLKGASTAPPLGVLQNNPMQGEAAHVMTDGISKCRIAGTVAINDVLGTDGNGKAVKGGSGTKGFGVAQESGVAGDIISVLLNSVSV